jgi:regulator of replication initiation timing
VNFQIRNDDTSSIEFWTDNQQRMTIDKTGWVGIGTLGFLSVAGTNSGPVGAAVWTGTGNTSTNPLLSVNGDVEAGGDIYSDGNIYILSDERLKTNFQGLDKWSKILEIPSYSYLINKDKTPITRYGFKAQEVYKTFPELTANWNGALSVNYIGFIPFMLQGIKEHEERLNTIENLRRNILEAEQKIMELEREIEELQNQNTQFAQRFGELEEENKDLKTRLADLEKFVYKQQGNGEGFGQSGNLNNPASLGQNEPNPFTQETLIRYYLPEGSTNAKIELKNSEGKIVGSFALSHTGQGSIMLSAGTLSAGTYFYSLVISNNIIETKKMILLN